MDNRDYEKLINIQTAKIGNMIINGVQMDQEITIMTCPNCNKVIQQFNQKVSPEAIETYLNQNRNELLNEFQYCSRCGQKLSYNYYIIDATNVETSNFNAN